MGRPYEGPAKKIDLCAAVRPGLTAISAQEVWRDEVDGTDRIARTDEGSANRIGKDAISEAIAHVLPRRQV